MQSQKDNFTVVPILVGSLTLEKEIKYGRIFAKYLADPTNMFIISSDFCHWGERFRYTEYDERKGEIHESIKALDYEVRYRFKTSSKNEIHNTIDITSDETTYIFIFYREWT